jgi:hypothetical protein
VENKVSTETRPLEARDFYVDSTHGHIEADTMKRDLFEVAAEVMDKGFAFEVGDPAAAPCSVTACCCTDGAPPGQAVPRRNAAVWSLG